MTIGEDDWKELYYWAMVNANRKHAWKPNWAFIAEHGVGRGTPTRKGGTKDTDAAVGLNTILFFHTCKSRKSCYHRQTEGPRL